MTEDFAQPIYDERTGQYNNPDSFKFKLLTALDGFKWKFLEKQQFKLPSRTKLDETLPIRRPQFNIKSRLAATWIGHATVVVEMDGARFITDPIWASRASPFSWIGLSKL